MTTISGRVEKCNFLLGDNIEVTMSLKYDENDKRIKGERKCSYEFKSYDRNVRYGMIHRGNTTIYFKNDIGKFVVNTNHMSKGIYKFTGFSVNLYDEIYANFDMKSFGGIMINIVSTEEEFLTDVEMVGKNNAEVLEYWKRFDKGLVVSTNSEAKKFDCYVFASDIYIGKKIYIDICEIEPFSRIDNSNYVEYVDTFLKSIDVYVEEHVKSEISEDDPCKQPAIVIHYPKVIADDHIQASEATHNHAKKVIDSIAITNSSYGTIIGDVVICCDKNIKYRRHMYHSYLGNLFVGFENPKLIHKINEKISNDSLKKLYSELYLEACRERDKSIMYFKLWNLLEAIARNNYYVGNPMRDFDNNYILNKKKHVRKINDNARILVSELIREFIVNENRDKVKVKTNFELKNIEDRITVWYQRRNCTAHRGKCCYGDNTICKDENKKMQLCRQAYDEMNKKVSKITL